MKLSLGFSVQGGDSGLPLVQVPLWSQAGLAQLAHQVVLSFELLVIVSLPQITLFLLTLLVVLLLEFLFILMTF